ncbi:WD40 repeat-like protein [Dendrothele bispora CBS 962.96]|uniref:WD40 repeat-like protein n=1 Tax=Dendrothele bispora (strain CBS 962.96) TaxID=1314807 RepID=A0A4S8MYN7_DENBC|nr:WD40 repeat-like protein [Dendrothele bispora CBS 962.96]
MPSTGPSKPLILHPTEKVWSIPDIHRLRKEVLSKTWEQTLDRVNVLGDNREYGHAGCVNALSWAREGEMLLSAGDDTTVQIWRMDPGNVTKDYPFICRSVIHTGHRANIFNAQMLPYSSRIVTVAGDREVRVFDIDMPSKYGLDRNEYSSGQCKTHTFSCHKDRVKRIVTEESPNTFLTVSEDGTVRQHDLRTPHRCRAACPTPILHVKHDLSTLAMSPLTPYHIVVAGSSPYGYLFDRRYTGRDIQEEKGMASDGLTTCIRRFGQSGKEENATQAYVAGDHITGARMSSENGHEVLLSYSGDGVYLFSTLDDPTSPSDISNSGKTKTLLKSKCRKKSGDIDQLLAYSEGSSDLDPDEEILPLLEYSEENDEDEEDEGGQDEDEDEDDDDMDMDARPEDMYQPGIPVVKPRRRYAGARNINTVKDVNFLGPFDEYVTSGSDDGNLFIWRKSTGELHGIYEGDGSVVNVIEPHPYLPLVAVSGIDYTVKLFAPTNRASDFSRIYDAEGIIQRNAERPTDYPAIRRIDLVSLLASMRAASAGGGQLGEEAADCVNQ